jgi:16S rRNA (uracil1498-N3)-methyltransferase
LRTLGACTVYKQLIAPILHEPLPLSKLPFTEYEARFIAHCDKEQPRNELAAQRTIANSILMLIGPEGDFSQKEIDLCIEHHCSAVSIGNTRLRTETAGLVAVSIIKHLSIQQ